jgi:hypothetical protein
LAVGRLGIPGGEFMEIGEFRRFVPLRSPASRSAISALRAPVETRPTADDSVADAKIVRLQRPWFGTFPTGNGPQAA